ncbi:MAG: hypothetical protein K2N44_18365 [Lachnospiraceae bacterium]|nr:hypothetical protein [Lachnospiraceae bacterium]
MGILGGCDYLETSGSVFMEYHCKRSKQKLESWTATNICMTNRHTECADYKGSSGCFITTAVCLTMGKPDDCEELTAMRLFRDKWLRDQPDGSKLIEDYYQTAPAIVDKIDQQPDRESIYSAIYKDYILPCVDCVKAEKFADSKKIYVDMVTSLKEQYC